MKVSASENIFRIPVGKDFIVYSPLADVVSLVNNAGIIEIEKLLRRCENEDKWEDGKLRELVNELLGDNLIQPVKKSGALNPEFLGFIPTRSCNSSCNYCDFGADRADKGKMSYALAVSAVDWYIKVAKANKKETIEIHFFGGEPMLARDVIETVVHRARLKAAEEKLSTYFEISTNGQYGVSDAGFLGRYFNKVVLSLDGPEKVQNTHRPMKNNGDSYKNAVNTAKILSNSDAELCIRCCVSRLNCDQMSGFAEWLCNNLKLSAINFEILSETDQTKANGLFPPDPVDFAVNFQMAREAAAKYGVEVVYSSDINNIPSYTSCPVGKDAAIISPGGEISSCYLLPERWEEKGIEMEYGMITDTASAEIGPEKVRQIRHLVEDKPLCRSCFCKWSCAGGCHVGNSWPGCGTVYENFCKQTRLISTFSLLSALGFDDRIQKLMRSRRQMEKIALQASDKI